MRSSRRPKNPTEGEAYDALTALGWTVTKRGCPDFFIFKETPGHKDFAVVECKKPNLGLKTAQVKVMQALIAHGVRCCVWKRGAGLITLTANHSLLNPPVSAEGKARG